MDYSHFKAPNSANNPLDDKLYVQKFQRQIWGVYLIIMVYNSHDFDEPSSRWENAMDRYEDSRDDWDDEPEEDDK